MHKTMSYCWLLTHVALFLAVLLIHWVIREPFNSKPCCFFSFYAPFIPRKFHFSAVLPVSVSCKCVRRQRAGGHTQPHQIRGQPARLPAITSDLRSSSHFSHSLHLSNPRLPSSSPLFLPFISLALPANAKPHPLLPSSTKKKHFSSFLFTILGEICNVRNPRKMQRKSQMGMNGSGEMKKHLSSHSPRLVSVSYYGDGFPLPPLIEHRVHKLKDVRRAKLDRGART